jgi:serine kinase of HPr protein (carbohydrate metabolism regulator)
LRQPVQCDLDAEILSPHLHRLDSLKGPRDQLPRRGLVFFLNKSEISELCSREELGQKLINHGPAAVVTCESGAMRSTLGERFALASGLVFLAANQPEASLAEILGRKLFALVKSRISVHGVLMLIWGGGLLILGASGSGKTDTALELVRRGHRLVGDDSVELFCSQPGMVWGRRPGSWPGCMAVQGLGFIQVNCVCGTEAEAKEAPIRLVVELVEQSAYTYENPMEMKRRYLYLMGVPVPFLALSQERRPHLATLMEFAMRIHCSSGAKDTGADLTAAEKRAGEEAK